MGRRVLLIHPLRQDYWFSDTPHVGLAQLAAILTEARHEVRVIDYVLWGKHHPSTRDVVEIADDFAPEVIGLSMYTAVQSKTFELIEALSHLAAPILVGGPHCSINYDRLRLDDRLDYIFKGEAEATIADIVAGAERQEFPLVVETKPFEIDDLPHPDFSRFIKNSEMTAYPLITSRGCQFQCNFCVVSHVTNKQWRPRQVDLIVDECAALIPRYPNVRSVVIADDNPLSDRRRFKEFLRRYAEIDLGKLLSIANIRADTIDAEMLQLMKPANCQAICLGVESADPEVFKHVNKWESLEDIRRAAGLIKDAGLSLGMCFVIGLPHDSWEHHKNSVAFAKEFQPDYIYWNVMHPMKGTDAHYYFVQRGSEIQDDTDYTSLSDLTWETNEPLVETPEFTKWDRKKARYYAVVETDQYIPYPHLLGQFVARAREYSLSPTAIESLRRMRAKHAQIAPQIDRAIAQLRGTPAPTPAADDGAVATPKTAGADLTPAADNGATDGAPASPEPTAVTSNLEAERHEADGRPPVESWLASKLFAQSAEPASLLERFFRMYPQAPALAFWRALEAHALERVEFEGPVLDLGCGDGTFTEAIMGGRRVACGLDVETVNFPKARSLGVYERLATYDGGRMPFKDGHFRSIITNSVLEHVDDLETVLRECLRVLAPDGKLVLTVPVQAYDDLLYFAQLAQAEGDNAGAREHVAYHRDSSQHLNWWTDEGWRRRLEDLGFHIVESRGYVRQASAWVFDILKTLGDQGIWQRDPKDGAAGFKARFDRLLLERLLDEVAAADREADGPTAARLLVATVAAPSTGATQSDASPGAAEERSIFDNPAPFFKKAADADAYESIHAELTRDGLEHVRCYMCGADQPRPVGVKEGLTVVTCGGCGFFYVNPRIPENKLPQLYDRSYWFERMKLHGYPDVLRRAGHDYRLARQRWEAMQAKAPAGSYLDVGCSNGAMVKRASELGYLAFGLELNSEIAEIARQATTRPIYEGLLREQRFARAEFSVVTLQHVFEHLYDPRVELAELKRVLAPDGLLVIETFRRDCPQFQAGVTDMSHDDIKPGEHIYMYREEEIGRLLRDAGFKVDAVGYPDGTDNSRLLLHVRHAAVRAGPNGTRRRSGGGTKRKRRKPRGVKAARVSVIIPTHNRAEALGRTLAAYAEQTVLPAEVIVVDDGSSDDSEAAARGQPGLKVVYQRQHNAGPAAARNAALEKATGELVLITGDDIVPDSTLVERHVEAHRTRPDPNVAVVGRIEWSDEHRVTAFMEHITGAGGQQFNYAELERLDTENLPAGWFLTSNISLKRDWLGKTGEQFDERFPHAAYEDIELGMRLQSKHGLRISYAPDALGRHVHPQTYESFSRRQYVAGQSAAKLIEIHPETQAHFIKGDVPQQLAAAEDAMPAHEQAIAAFEHRLTRGERLSDVDRSLLNAHYAAALSNHHLRGLAHGLNGADVAQAPLTIAVISLNQRIKLAECLQAIRTHTSSAHRLMVIDAGSNESTPIALDGDITVVHQPSQRSRAWAINAAFEASTDDVVVMDASARVTDGWLDALLAALASSADAGLAGPMSSYAPLPQLVDTDDLHSPEADSEGIAERLRRSSAGQITDTDRLGDFCLAVRRAVIDAVGGFDEQFAHEGQFGDWDFTLRARRAGFRALVARAAYVGWDGERRGFGAGVKHEEVVRASWRRFCAKWDLNPDTSPGDASAIEPSASQNGTVQPDAGSGGAPTVFVAAPNWLDPNSTWQGLVQAYATGFGPRDAVELRLLVDRNRGFNLDKIVESVQTLVGELNLDPDDSPGLELVDDYAWVGGAPDAFRSADVFVATEPSLAELRGDYIKHAEDAGLPVIRKAELGDLYLEAAKSSNLAIVREPSWESLEAARLTSRMRAERQPIGTY